MSGPISVAIKERVGAVRSAAKIPGWIKRPINRDLTQFLMENKYITEEFHAAITGGEIIENMSGAASVVFNINDASRNLLHRGLLAHWVKMTPVLKGRDKHRRLHLIGNPAWSDITAELDGRFLALAGVTKNGNEFDLTFENRAVNELRKYNSYKKWDRSVFTRAQAIKSMVDEVKGFSIPFYSPELHQVQPIASSGQQPTSSQATKTMGKGFSATAAVTVKGAPASAQQKSYIARVLATGESLGATYTVLVSAVMTITQESDVSIDRVPTAMGLFDQNPNDGWPATGDNIEADSTAYFKGIPGHDGAIAVAQKNPGFTPGEIAQAVQVSAYPSAYDQWEVEAKKTVALYGGGTSAGGAGGTSTTFTEFNKFFFSRGTQGKPEDSWTAIERLATEVAWRAFMLDNTLYYVEDNQLLNQRPYDTISEKDDGIDEINYNIDSGKPVSQVTVLVHVDRWQTPPGALITIDEGGSPADGNWLVQQNRWPLFGRQAEVTLQLPVPPKAEPAPTTRTVNVSTPGGSAVQGGIAVPVDKDANIGRLDAGFDGDTKHYYAVFSGVFHNAGARWAGYGNGSYCYIVNDDQSGPDYTKAAYYAEDIVPVVSDGAHVSAGQLIGNSSGSAFEIGAAAASLNYDPLAHVFGAGTPGARSAALDFYNMCVQAGMPQSNDTSNAGNFP